MVRSLAKRTLVATSALVLIALVTVTMAAPPTAGAPDRPAYPLRKSGNGRYFVDSNGVPFLVAGESPQAMMVNVSEADAELFFANRRKHAFNAVWINLLCRKGTGGRADGSTSDGVRPFTAADDFAQPNEAYFARCDRMIELATKYGFLVFLDPAETIDHLAVMRANGKDKCRAFGRYLGHRYRRFNNLIWLSGNDFHNWRNPDDDALALAIAEGIHDEAPSQLQTVELQPDLSGSLDDERWTPLAGLATSYTYYPTYAQVTKDYLRAGKLPGGPMPVVMIESDYEFERDATPAILRRIEYWSLLSGAAGQLYGNGYTWPFAKGWKEKLDTPGAIQMAFLQGFFESRRWYDLIPDLKHEWITAGYGTFDETSTAGNRFVMTSDYVTAARTPDGTLAVAYLPSRRTITADLAKLSGPITVRWYDPSDGSYTPVDGSPMKPTGTRSFTPPGNNKDDDGDWVLLMEASK